MHGNVWEWCLDKLQDDASGSLVDPLGDTGGLAKRAIRGGSWNFSARYCRSAFRSASGPGNRFSGLGFRLVAGQEPGPDSGC